MRLAGSHDLPFPRDAVWEALMDPQVLSRTLPGCEQLERTGDDVFAGRLRVSVGPVRGEFRGTLKLTDLSPPGSYRMRLDGQGPNGFMNGEGTVQLEDTATGTRLHYDLDAQVGGRIAGVGQRVLDSSARSVARQGLAGLERQLTARHGTPPAAAEKKGGEFPAEGGKKGGELAVEEGGDGENAAVAGDSPPQAGFAATVARDVLADLVPPQYRLVIAVAFLAGLLLGFVLGLVL